MNSYDFKGNPLETQQQLLEDAIISEVDWSSNPVLSVEVFISAITYDALNRPITQTDPGGNVQAFTYDKGGVLKKVKLNTDEYVNDIHYDAKGQRQAIWYGNGTKTSYTYDAFTFRLRRLLTVNLNTNDILQDLNYWYDPVGNITEIQDDAQQILFFNNSVVAPTQKFVYNAIYRLIEAKGRELIGTANFGNEDNWNDAAWKTNHKGDGNAVQNYTQKYSYDEVGNILQLQHIAGTGSYTRTYNYDINSNKLLSTEVGSNTYSYSHDTRGNMTEMSHLSSLAWNTQNELKSIMRGSEPTCYQYSNGERVRKFTDKGIIKEERIYLGNFEIYRKFDNGSLTQSTGSVPKVERTTVRVSDDMGRIAMLEKRTAGSAADDNGTAEELTRYIYSNHLQSASLELDETGEIISYEEYHPYGTTSYQAMNPHIKTVAKRYRYTGKERDEESGLYYHGARYYVPWLRKWTAVDPLEEKFPWQSPYSAFNNNPIVNIDPDGRASVKSIGSDDPIKDLFRKASNYAVNKTKQAIYNLGVNLTKATIEYVDKNYNPVTIYENITNPNSDLPEWQAKSLAKYSDVAISADEFVTSIKGLSKRETKRQREGLGSLGSQSGGPVSRYVFDPANPDRVIDMRHFLSIGDMGEILGLGVEIMQSTKESWRPSAFDLQDFYSNNLGKQFYESIFYKQYKSKDIEFSEALNNFFEHRVKQ